MNRYPGPSDTIPLGNVRDGALTKQPFFLRFEFNNRYQAVILSYESVQGNVFDHGQSKIKLLDIQMNVIS